MLLIHCKYQRQLCCCKGDERRRVQGEQKGWEREHPVLRRIGEPTRNDKVPSKTCRPSQYLSNLQILQPTILVRLRDGLVCIPMGYKYLAIQSCLLDFAKQNINAAQIWSIHKCFEMQVSVWCAAMPADIVHEESFWSIYTTDCSEDEVVFMYCHPIIAE